MWPSEDEHEVVLCNGTHLSIWTGDELNIHASPRHREKLFLLGNEDWYEHGEISELCSAAKDVKWRRKVVSELEKMLSQWTWKNEMSPQILCGLIGATFMQTVFAWRPMVSILGESNTGKSTLLDFLSNEDDYSLFRKSQFSNF